MIKQLFNFLSAFYWLPIFLFHLTPVFVWAELETTGGFSKAEERAIIDLAQQRLQTHTEPTVDPGPFQEEERLFRERYSEFLEIYKEYLEGRLSILNPEVFAESQRRPSQPSILDHYFFKKRMSNSRSFTNFSQEYIANVKNELTSLFFFMASGHFNIDSRVDMTNEYNSNLPIKIKIWFFTRFYEIIHEINLSPRLREKLGEIGSLEGVLEHLLRLRKEAFQALVQIAKFDNFRWLDSFVNSNEPTLKVVAVKASLSLPYAEREKMWNFLEKLAVDASDNVKVAVIESLNELKANWGEALEILNMILKIPSENLHMSERVYISVFKAIAAIATMLERVTNQKTRNTLERHVWDTLKIVYGNGTEHFFRNGTEHFFRIQNYPNATLELINSLSYMVNVSKAPEAPIPKTPESPMLRILSTFRSLYRMTNNVEIKTHIFRTLNEIGIDHLLRPESHQLVAQLFELGVTDPNERVRATLALNLGNKANSWSILERLSEDNSKYVKEHVIQAIKEKAELRGLIILDFLYLILVEDEPPSTNKDRWSQKIDQALQAIIDKHGFYTVEEYIGAQNTSPTKPGQIHISGTRGAYELGRMAKLIQLIRINARCTKIFLSRRPP